MLGDDPTCAIAYRGMALSDWSNPFALGIQDAGQLRLGRKNLERGKSRGAKPERQQAYLAAVGELYSGFESTSQQVYWRSRWRKTRGQDLQKPAQSGNDSLAHYIIHAYDVPTLAGRR